jgi:hypothetical protein
MEAVRTGQKKFPKGWQWKKFQKGTRTKNFHLRKSVQKGLRGNIWMRLEL